MGTIWDCGFPKFKPQNWLNVEMLAKILKVSWVNCSTKLSLEMACIYEHICEWRLCGGNGYISICYSSYSEQMLSCAKNNNPKPYTRHIAINFGLEDIFGILGVCCWCSLEKERNYSHPLICSLFWPFQSTLRNKNFNLVMAVKLLKGWQSCILNFLLQGNK